MNITLNNSLPTGIDNNELLDLMTFFARNSAIRLQEILNTQGFSVSLRWTSLLLAFLSFLVIYIGLKITKPIVKFILIFIAILLIIGLIVPFW